MICDWNLDQKLQLCGIIVDGLAAVGAIAAIFIALKANKQNRTEIAQAQAEIANSLKIQEQSKNIELLNPRLELLNKIKEFKLPDYELDYLIRIKKPIVPNVAEEEIIILFNNDPMIMKIYKGLFDKIEKQESNISNLYHFSEHYYCMNQYGCPINEVMEKIMRYERLLSSPECPDNIEQDLINEVDNTAFSEENIITKEIAEYNYADIISAINTLDKEFESDKESLITKIRIFIDESIKPIKEM